jgi:hypothetical protein
MKRWAAIPVLLCLAGCEDGATPFAAYQRPGDGLASVLHLGLIGIYPCTTRETVRGSTIIANMPTDRCYKMQPARRFRGIWLDEFEGSVFFENMLTVDRVRDEIRHRPNSSEWLEAEAPFTAVASRTSPNSRMIRLDFIGRRTAHPGRYGHAGMSRSIILVDRIISADVVYQSSEPYMENELRR